MIKPKEQVLDHNLMSNAFADESSSPKKKVKVVVEKAPSTPLSKDSVDKRSEDLLKDLLNTSMDSPEASLSDIDPPNTEELIEVRNSSDSSSTS